MTERNRGHNVYYVKTEDILKDLKELSDGATIGPWECWSRQMFEDGKLKGWESTSVVWI